MPGVNRTSEALYMVNRCVLIIWRAQVHWNENLVGPSTAQERKGHLKVSRGDEIWWVLPGKLFSSVSPSSSWPCWISASVCTLEGPQGCQSCAARAAAPPRRRRSSPLPSHNSDLQATNRWKQSCFTLRHARWRKFNRRLKKFFHILATWVTHFLIAKRPFFVIDNREAMKHFYNSNVVSSKTKYA